MLGISVVVCTYNGSKRIEKTLRSLVDTIATCNWEIIIVDNNSTDDTSEFVNNLMQSFSESVKWRLVFEGKPGLAFARIRGLRESAFDYVLFCDDDNALCPTYIQTGFEIFTQHNMIGVLGGFGIPVIEGVKPGWFDRYSHSYAVGPQASQDGKINKMPAEVYGAGAFFRKKVLLSFFEKGFRSALSDRKGNSLASGGDVEWCYLLQLAGYEVWYDSRLQFEHSIPESRLQWDYYIRLKKGITSGSGSLLPYQVIFDGHRSNFQYLFAWSKRMGLSTLHFVKCRMMVWIQGKNNDPAMALHFAITRSRVDSYRVNFLNGYRHFLSLKKMIA